MCLYVCIVLRPELQLAKGDNGPIHVHYHTHAKDCTFNIGSLTPVPPCPGKISSPVSWVQLLQQSSSNDVRLCVRACMRACVRVCVRACVRVLRYFQPSIVTETRSTFSSATHNDLHTENFDLARFSAAGTFSSFFNSDLRD